MQSGTLPRFLSRAVCASAFALCAIAAPGEVLNESAKLTASDGETADEFGSAVSVDGRVAAIGASDDGDLGFHSGSVYVFRRVGDAWFEEQKLLASDGMEQDRFGTSVAVEGEIVIVGAPWASVQSLFEGSAYVFRWTGSFWMEEQKLVAADAALVGLLGESVSVSGDVAVLGAPFTTINTSSEGAAYVFRWDGSSWVEEQALVASDGQRRDEFGKSVSVSGDVAVVGAWHDDDAGNNTGSAYVFRWDGSTWLEEQKLLPPDGTDNQLFGASVQVRDDVVVVGARHDNVNGTASGSAFVYRRDEAAQSWQLEQKLFAPDAAAGDQFGHAVTIFERLIVVGTIGEDDNGQNAGAAYVFRRRPGRPGLWEPHQKLLASDGEANDTLGWSVGVSGDVVVAAAVLDNDNGPISGSAYVFDLPPAQVEVSIDIKPGSDLNPLNLGARGVLPVAVLTTRMADGDPSDFDAADVDPSSLTLAGASARTKGRSGRVGSYEDVDGDGDGDLVVHFPIAELSLTEKDAEAILEGQTFDGTPIFGRDTVATRSSARSGEGRAARR